MNGPTLNGGHSSCVSAEELILYKQGILDGERLGVVRHHLESCLLCLDALLHVAIDSSEDELVKVPADFMVKLNQIAREAWKNVPSKKLPA